MEVIDTRVFFLLFTRMPKFSFVGRKPPTLGMQLQDSGGADTGVVFLYLPVAWKGQSCTCAAMFYCKI